jgi:predicted nucleic acid binding AN1-type Zn finger protein
MSGDSSEAEVGRATWTPMIGLATDERTRTMDLCHPHLRGGETPRPQIAPRCRNPLARSRS